MGVVRKESSFSTLSAYFGAALGLVNKIILLPRFFDLDQVGLLNISINMAMTLAQLALLGYGIVTIKFFPFFKDRENMHNGILFLGFIFGSIGFLLIGSAFLLCKDLILNHLSVNSALLVEHYHIIFIIGFFFLGFNIYTCYLQVLFKTYVVSLIRDIFLRVMVTVSIFLYAVNLVTFEEFIWIFTVSNCSIALIIIAYVIWLKQNFIRPKLGKEIRQNLREIVGYGFFAFLGSTSYLIVMTVDAVMVADMVSLEKAGVYTTYMYVTAFILFPYRALTSVSAPKVGEFWKTENITGLQELYQRVSFLSLLFGLVLFFGIWINRNNLVKLTTPEFAGAEIALLLLALTKLIDMASGLNTSILMASKMFKYDLILNIFLAFLSIILNIQLIRLYGIDGAALATFISWTIIQIGRVLLLYIAYGLYPFSSKMLSLLLFAGIAFIPDFFIPVSDPFWVDIAVRSITYAFVYGILVYFSGVSPDVNRLILLVKRKII